MPNAEGSRAPETSAPSPAEQSDITDSWNGGRIRPWQMRACHFFTILVILRLQFFEVPCDKGVCKTPVEIVAVELYAYDKAPHSVIKAMLYPGAFAERMQLAMIGERSESMSWDNLLDEYKNITTRNANEQPFPTSLEMAKQQRLDLISGSFMVVFGALMATLGPNVGCSVGMALLFVYLLRESLNPHPFMLFAAGCSLAWIPIHRLTESSAEKFVASTAPPSQPRKLKTRGKFKVY